MMKCDCGRDVIVIMTWYDDRSYDVTHNLMIPPRNTIHSTHHYLI